MHIYKTNGSRSRHFQRGETIYSEIIQFTWM